eukprot:scaffold144600_cov235-Phaeocystis_antarctica.AAC.1
MVVEQQRAVLPRFLVAWGTAGRAAAAVATAVAALRRDRPARAAAAALRRDRPARAAAAAAVVAAAAPWLRGRVAAAAAAPCGRPAAMILVASV